MKIKLKNVFIPSLLLANLLSSNVNATNLEDRVHHFEKLGWSIGVTVLETDNGEKESIHGDKRFHFNSTIKALACANILEKSDKNIISLDDSIKLKKGDIVTYSPVTKDYVGRNLTLKQACDATLTYSDNTAANYTISAGGGPNGLTNFMRSIGDDVLRSDRYEPELTKNIEYDIRDTTTTNAMTSSLNKILLGNVLSDSSKKQLRAWMEGNKVADNLLRVSLPSGWSIADRSGASDYGVRGIIALAWSESNSPVIIAMYVRKEGTSMAERDQVIADLGHVIFDKYQ
ncbi:class A beta-lactamase [Vibrio toranzoniae]|uniref:Beta-lactamase n=1 Tax=Vibrio toranzoniae TaxID=1194427 RepID=A0A109D985_9VIBR|nr:class A beta-lactamase [Vibrio toranzoniae]KWU01209.1 class A beta-lactamase [Vibrio toranzoniae]SBS34148.1 Beta-lactamase PSE-4 precursor [Vibrio toranzoniae]